MSMSSTQWKLLLRFMFWVIYLLNRATNRPPSTWGGAGKLEYDLDELLCDENGDFSG